jgi:hypothetical protein
MAMGAKVSNMEVALNSKGEWILYIRTHSDKVPFGYVKIEPGIEKVHDKDIQKEIKHREQMAKELENQKTFNKEFRREMTKNEEKIKAEVAKKQQEESEKISDRLKKKLGFGPSGR